MATDSGYVATYDGSFLILHDKQYRLATPLLNVWTGDKSYRRPLCALIEQVENTSTKCKVLYCKRSWNKPKE
jgi:hypothetical protein